MPACVSIYYVRNSNWRSYNSEIFRKNDCLYATRLEITYGTTVFTKHEIPRAKHIVSRKPLAVELRYSFTRTYCIRIQYGRVIISNSRSTYNMIVKCRTFTEICLFSLVRSSALVHNVSR